MDRVVCSNIDDQLRMDHTKSQRETWGCRPDSRQDFAKRRLPSRNNPRSSSKNGKVRSALVKYKNYKAGERNHEYTAGEEVVVSRSVHRLAFLVPVECDKKNLKQISEKTVHAFA